MRISRRFGAAAASISWARGARPCGTSSRRCWTARGRRSATRSKRNSCPSPAAPKPTSCVDRPRAARRSSPSGAGSRRGSKTACADSKRRVATGRLKDRGKIERVLGRLQASYASVADLYEMAVREQDGQLRLHWALIEDRRAWRDAREGAYLLRTNLVGQTVEQLWTKYIQLTEAEAAFRALKSELAVRPVFHQLERRAKAHLLVAFLGYALWVTLKHLLHRGRTGLTPARALALLATLQSADIILPTTDGREIRLRRVTQPTPEQQRLLDQLEITIPTHLEWNAECSADFVAS